MNEWKFIYQNNQSLLLTHDNVFEKILGGSRILEYTVPINNPIGPKATKCKIHEQINNKSDR